MKHITIFNHLVILIIIFIGQLGYAQGLKITSGTTLKMTGTIINLVVDDGGIADQVDAKT